MQVSCKIGYLCASLRTSVVHFHFLFSTFFALPLCSDIFLCHYNMLLSAYFIHCIISIYRALQNAEVLVKKVKGKGC